VCTHLVIGFEQCREILVLRLSTDLKKTPLTCIDQYIPADDAMGPQKILPKERLGAIHLSTTLFRWFFFRLSLLMTKH
jgi:hypothetical protein